MFSSRRSASRPARRRRRHPSARAGSRCRSRPVRSPRPCRSRRRCRCPAGFPAQPGSSLPRPSGAAAPPKRSRRRSPPR
ncbi:MAG: hypothetical protein CVU20_13420 [Betaproteobacteria bacterium HGW-Betaproteobacteria-14]|nr:MAG: hypothetical protein CVU20_13420 [Betaproteobacteria bacterium HGW-Betaproteobacteria-14]